MVKRKGIKKIFSMLVMLVFLLASFLMPVSKEKPKFAKADASGETPIYAFASAHNKANGNGKIYVDIGLSLDMLDDGEITRSDATATVEARLKTFESATIYYRTRNLSAIAEEGDYEAINQSVNVRWNSPYKTVSVYINGASDLQIGEATRQFYVEVYKVEINGEQEGYKFKAPNETPQYSIETISIDSELSLKKTKEKAVDGGTLEFMDEFGVLKTNLDGTKCDDTWNTSSFKNAKVNLASFGDDWYRKLKYLSDRDMLKLGVQVTGLVEQTTFAWLYTDDAYVGIQLFVGDSAVVGAPDLPNIPKKNIYWNDPSVEEYASWYIKMEEDAQESINVTNAFNGTFLDLTVSSKFKKEILLANGVYQKTDGSGGYYDENTGAVDKNIFVIDDLDGLLKGQTVLSARGWSYESSEVLEFINFNANYAPINYRAKKESATLGALRYDENGNAKIGLSVRFSEPVQLKKNTGSKNLPYIEAQANGFSDTPLQFVYVAGDGTDTFYFEADASQINTKISSIVWQSANNFDLIYDFAPWTEGILDGNQALNMILPSKLVNGWVNILEEEVDCSYDLRVPVLEGPKSDKISKIPKTSHAVTIETPTISETGTLYYGWSVDKTVVPLNLSKMPTTVQGYQTVYSPSNISGTRYLYAYAVSEADKKSEPIWVGPYYFDNDAPNIDVKVPSESDGYKEKIFNLTITNKSGNIESFIKYANLSKTVSVIVSTDYQGEDVLDIKPSSITLTDDQLAELAEKGEITLNFSLKATALGLEEGGEREFGTYYVFFSACDDLGNQGISEPTACYFDARKILRVELFRSAGDPDFEMDEFKAGGALYRTLDKNYYTLDLSKMDKATDFFFKFKVAGADTSGTGISLKVHSFDNVATKESALSYISDESSNFLGKVKIKEKFAPGLYSLIFADTNSDKTSEPVYFYVTKGKDADTLRYAEETGVYKSIGGGSVFTNEVFQLPTTTYYYYMTDTNAIVKESYSSNTNKPATFSSLWTAYSYVYYREFLDLYAVTLTQNAANYLNGGIYRKAAGDMERTAQPGQVWIRYKDENWRSNSTMNAWVYYYYGEDSSSLPINTDEISSELFVAISMVAASICEKVEKVDLVTQEYLNSYGAPTLLEGQLHVQPESSSVSKSGTVFAKPVDYLGDPLIYLSFDPDAPLSTNALVQRGENKQLYYKTEGSVYHKLIWDDRKTLGEYLNATGQFMILELDENGAREYFVYIDKTAPTIKISWEGLGGEREQEFNAWDSNEPISGSYVYIQNMEDEDAYAYVAIYRYTGQGEGNLLRVHRKRDFDEGLGMRLDDGKYHIHVSDRSGNDYTFVVQVKSDVLVCDVKEVQNSHLQIEMNRSESEIRYQVFLDNWIYTTDYNMKKFTESGEYRFLIEDVYGNVHDETISFIRHVPLVTWSYQTSDNRFVEYSGDQEEMKLYANSEQSYSITTSTRLRFTMMSGCAYEILSGSPSLTPNPSAGWVTFNSITPFSMKVFYEKYPETYVIYTCSVDNFAPKVSVSYQKSEYMFLELDEIGEIFKTTGFKEGETDFTPNSIGFKRDQTSTTTMYVANGEQVQSKYYYVQVSDENDVKNVEIYLDGELILTRVSDFNNIYLSRRGKYQIVATDTFGNSTTFTFTNDSYDYVEYFVDEKEASTDISFIDYFVNGVYTKVEYGVSQTQVRISSSAEVHYLITEENGNRYHIAFVVENGSVYTLKYVIKVGNGQIENIAVRGTTTLTTGEVACIQNLGVAIFLEKTSDQAISLIVRSVNREKKTYTVETRVSTDKNEMPYYFKAKLSNMPSTVVLTNEKGEALEIDDPIKINEAFKVKNEFGADIESVEVAYSQTGNYQTYEMIYKNGNGYRDVLFSNEGMYHVKVINRYGSKTDYYILLFTKLAVMATVEYTDGTSVEYSMNYTAETDEFYSNKSVKFIVHSSNLKILEMTEGISAFLTTPGYTTIYIDKPGNYDLKLEDEFGNLFEKTIFIQTKNLELNEGVLTKFNGNVLGKEEKYTNQKVFIDENAAINKNGIAFISMSYGAQTIILYDDLHEEKTSFVKDRFVGSFEDGEYVLFFRDRYGNKTETTVHYCGTPTLTILRKTLNSVGTEIYPIDKVLQEGVWTNDSVSFLVSASKYLLTVDGLENVLSIRYDSKTKDEYAVHYQDEYGFEYQFSVHLLRENVMIEPTAEMKVSMLSDSLVTKDSVRITFSENATCTYVLNNAEEQPYHSGDVLHKDGVYRFKAMDKAGNVSTYVVKKDSAVEYHFEDERSIQALINGEVVNSRSVRFFVDNSDSAYIKKVFHNNELVKHDEKVFNDRGKWEVIVADEVGNESYFRFYILYGKINGFTYAAPYDYTIDTVMWKMENSSALATETIKDSGRLLEATENGNYTVTMIMRSPETGEEIDRKTFTFTIDKTPPKVELVGCEENEKTINNVTLKGCSVGDTIYVYKGDKLVKTVYMDSEFRAAPTIKEGGKYRFVVENEAGVRTELTFERKYIPNAAGSVLIIAFSLTLVAGLLIGLIWHNHSKTDD